MINTSPVKITGHIARLTLSGVVINESGAEVAVRDPQSDVQRMPEDVFAFFYYNVSSTTLVCDTQAVFITSERHTLSGRHFIDGTVLTIEEVRGTKNAMGLREMMELNGWKALVKTRAGNVMQFDPNKDEVVSSK